MISFVRKGVGRTRAKIQGLWYSGSGTLAKRGRWAKPVVVYVGDSAWVLSTIGRSVGQHLEGYYKFAPHSVWRDVRQSLVHFGSSPAYFGEGLFRQVHHSNRQVVSWMHGQRSNPNRAFSERLDKLGESEDFVDKIVVPASIAYGTLVAEGVAKAKIVQIPLGIDTEMFYRPNLQQRMDVRKQLEIPENVYCVGSFQKDGDGFDEGLSPKWVKGPDTFLGAIDLMRHDFDLVVLLTGPARGYVKRGLDEMRVSYRHVLVKHYRDVARYFWALDLYIIASRDEGGPMALLESMASGVPLVSTRVGMCADLIEEGKNGLLVEVEDVQGLAESAARMLEDDGLRRMVSSNGYATSMGYEWSEIAKRYHDEVYRPLLVEAGYEVDRWP